MSPNNGLIFKVFKTQPASLSVDSTAKYTLLTLLDYWNPKSAGAVVWPGLERLAEQTGLSTRTVQRAIGKLEVSDLLKTNRRPNQPNRYTLNVALIGRLCDQAPELGHAKMTHPDQDGCDKMASSDVTKWHPNALENALDKGNALRHSPRQNEMALLSDILQTAVSGKT